MPNQSAALDRIFSALADPTRRAIIERLTRGPASVSELAKPLRMSLPSVVQHLQLLEQSGFIATRKIGRVRTCRIEPKQLATAQTWLARQRARWLARLDRLDALVLEMDDDKRKP
jgi:DNA-binding transcriptional ArsR family regulator